MASSQVPIVDWLTGYGATDSEHSPSALIRSASAMIRSCLVPHQRGTRGRPEAEHRDQLALHLLDAAAERQDQVPLLLAVEVRHERPVSSSDGSP